MAQSTEQQRIPIVWLNDEEARAFFDEQAQALLSISGEEFLRRWDAGEYDSVWDDPEHYALGYLVALLPFAR